MRGAKRYVVGWVIDPKGDLFEFFAEIGIVFAYVLVFIIEFHRELVVVKLVGALDGNIIGFGIIYIILDT
jgi:hypothetical protein